MTLYLGQIPPEFTDVGIANLLNGVNGAKVIGRIRLFDGFGFASFADEMAASLVIDALDDRPPFFIKIRWANDDTKRRQENVIDQCSSVEIDDGDVEDKNWEQDEDEKSVKSVRKDIQLEAEEEEEAETEQIKAEEEEEKVIDFSPQSFGSKIPLLRKLDEALQGQFCSHCETNEICKVICSKCEKSFCQFSCFFASFKEENSQHKLICRT